MTHRFLDLLLNDPDSEQNSRTIHACTSTSSQSERFFEIWHPELYDVNVFQDLARHCKSV